MGLFSAFKDSKPEIEFLDDTDAKVTLLTAIAFLDGDLDDSEIETSIIMKYLCVGTDMVEQANDEFGTLIEDHSIPAIVAAAFNYIDPATHKTVYFAACMIAMADGVIDDEEEDALLDMAKLSPSISEDESSSIIRFATMLTKERALI